MTACLPLQDCIVQTTSLQAYGRKFQPLRWSPVNKATGLLICLVFLKGPQLGSCKGKITLCEGGRVKFQSMKYSEVIQPTAKQTNKQTRLPAYGRIVLHAYRRRYMGAARLQWQILKLHGCALGCPAAAAVSQTA
jgi:hypothetical protein